MKFTVTIDCGNAAFNAAFEDAPGTEVARILRELADLIDGAFTASTPNTSPSGASKEAA